MTKTILLSDKVSYPAGIMTQGVETPAGTIVFISGQGLGRQHCWCWRYPRSDSQGAPEHGGRPSRVQCHL